jgi:hypothetical protein
MTEASARIIADSITETGNRLTTFEATCWRPVLAEQNTHCVLSRNSASSRAIPVKKQLDRFDGDFAAPLVWPAEQRGMQGGADLEGEDLDDARRLWNDLRWYVSDHIRDYVAGHPEADTRLHKSMLNRWLEVGLWQTQIISATQWDGYFWQRCHQDAEPHIRAMAQAMSEEREMSTPQRLWQGEWHLPYWALNGGHPHDWEDAVSYVGRNWADQTTNELSLDDLITEVAKRCSAARCARVSYLTQGGERSLSEDLDLYARLTSNRVGSKNPPHASPLEHVATPWPANINYVTMPNGKSIGPLPKLGKFVGYLQLRHLELEF